MAATSNFSPWAIRSCPAASRVRLNTASSVPGYLYLVGEERASAENPTGLSILHAGGVTTAVTTGWFVLSGGPAAEQLWLIWSPAVVTELAGIVPLLNDTRWRDRPGLRGGAAAARAAGTRRDAARETRDPIAVRATLRASAAPIVKKLELQHA